LLFVFSGFILIGFFMYAVYYVYTNYREEVIAFFKKYPEIEYIIRKIASFTSIELREDEASNLRSNSKEESEKMVTLESPRRKKKTPRQEKIIQLLTMSEKMDMSEIQKHFSKVNVRTLRRDLSSLESSGMITKVGRTKGAFYKLV